VIVWLSLALAGGVRAPQGIARFSPSSQRSVRWGHPPRAATCIVAGLDLMAHLLLTALRALHCRRAWLDCPLPPWAVPARVVARLGWAACLKEKTAASTTSFARW
jgi:hypothetical protein